MNINTTLDVIKKYIGINKLNLEGLTVLTEAATGYYAFTPIICALAGAKKVYALAKDTKYGSIEKVKQIIQNIAKEVEVNKIEIITEKEQDIISQADIVANLGHVRPIDKKMINDMKESAVIPLMFETWEFRKSDIDLEECRKKGICVLGTNEEHKNIDMFKHSGTLVLKLIEKLTIEIKDSKVVIVGDNKFSNPIKETVKKLGAEVKIVKEDEEELVKKVLTDANLAIISTFPSDKIIIGENGLVKTKDLKKDNPNILIVQFFGGLDRKDLKKYEVLCVPEHDPGFDHMGLTMDALGPEQIMKLNIASLKVAEIMARERLKGSSPEEAEKTAIESGLGQGF